MSKIGKTPIQIKNGTQVDLEGDLLKVSGPKGNTAYKLPAGISASIADGILTFGIKDIRNRTMREMYGLTRANVANILKGFDNGFKKDLEIQGVGYRAQMQGNELVLSLGFSHLVKFKPHQDIKIAIAENIISVSGTDKMLVGETAAKIRAIKPPEPYKGKGIRYKGEQVKRKLGKAAKAVGTK